MNELNLIELYLFVCLSINLKEREREREICILIWKEKGFVKRENI